MVIWPEASSARAEGTVSALDHVAAVLGQLVVQVLGRMADEVAVLVHGAALDRQVLAPERGERGLEPRRAVDAS